MDRSYVTFGQSHAHSVNGKTLDKDTVAVFDAPTYEIGRHKAFKVFGDKFAFHYYGKQWNKNDISYYPKGYVFLDI